MPSARKSTVALGGRRTPRPSEPRSEPFFKQFRRDVAASVKDTQNQHALALNGECNADGTPVTNNPQPRHDLNPLSARCGKVDSPRQWSRLPTTKFQAIVGDARSACRHRAAPAQLPLWGEDNSILHPLLGFRLFRAMARLQSGRDRIGRDDLRRIPPELSKARWDVPAQPFLPLSSNSSSMRKPRGQLRWRCCSGLIRAAA